MKELRTVLATDLEQHPGNWRTHTKRQRATLKAMVDEVGMATAVIAYEQAGKLRIIDGHLRTDLAKDALIPVLVLDVNEQEANQLLLTMDPIAAMAGEDSTRLAELLQATRLPDGAADLEAKLLKSTVDASSLLDPKNEIEINPTFQVVVGCQDEEQQAELFERLTAEGFDCKILTT